MNTFHGTNTYAWVYTERNLIIQMNVYSQIYFLLSLMIKNNVFISVLIYIYFPLPLIFWHQKMDEMKASAFVQFPVKGAGARETIVI